jgi:hypothetical protein
MNETTKYQNSRKETITLTHLADGTIQVRNNEWAVEVGTTTSMFIAQRMGEIDVEDLCED